jgi:serine/threonine-protein kinase
MESGQTIAGKYRLNQLLGSGGMAEVWSATNTFTERQHAIKFMLPSVVRTPEAARRFLMEAKVSARIDHPNVIEIMDVGQTDDGTLFLVMELLTGVSLETALRRQHPPMTVHDFVYVMIDVARALAAAHKNGVIHRDLKPTNIFLHRAKTGGAVPKLLDFGVSKFLEDQANHALTVAGTVLGSPLYMSPEQARGEPQIDARTDVFAFGGILFEAFCGYRAYEGNNFNQLILTIATQEPKRIDECARPIPEPLRVLVRDCLVTDRRERIASFDVIADRLAGILPELAQSNLRLPSAHMPPSDPDATNALPIVRPSDKPPPHSAPPPAPPVPTAPMGTSNARPPATMPSAAPPPPGAITGQGGASFTVEQAPANLATTHLLHKRRKALALPLVLAVVAIITVGYVGARLVRGFRPAWPGFVARRISSPPPRPEPLLPASASAAAEPPLISVDSLPIASADPTQKPGRMGRILITATPGSCTVTVDGAPRGPTPTPPLDLSAGSHIVRCDSSGGRSRSTTIVVLAGSTTPIKFDLAD